MKRAFSLVLSLLMITVTAALPFSARADDGGSCGTGVSYSLNSNTGVLTVYGSGVMDDMSGGAPWKNNFAEIYEVNIEDGVTYVGNNAFSNLINLEEVYIGNSVKKIGNMAFSGAVNLKSVTIPDSVTEISNQAFYNSGLQFVYLGKSVKTIGSLAFLNTPSLQEIFIPDSVLTISDKSFGYNLESGSYVKNSDFTLLGCGGISNAKTYADKNGFNYEDVYSYSYGGFNCSFDKAGGVLTLFGTGETGARNLWYYYSDQIKKVDIKNGITKISVNSFSNCQNLENASLPQGLKTVEDNAFLNCPKLKSVSIPDSVSGIGDCAFGIIYNSSKAVLNGFSITSKCSNKSVQAYVKNLSNNGLNLKWNALHDFNNTGTIAKKASFNRKSGTIDHKCNYGCGKVTHENIDYVDNNIKIKNSSCTFNNKYQTPKVTVKDKKGNTLKKGKDYKITYSNNKNVGTAYATVAFTGKYEGKKKIPFKIDPKGTRLTKVTRAKKSFTVKWRKQTTETTGYQIQYSTDRNFKKDNKTVTVNKNKTTKYTVKKLKQKKIYYIRIRTYKTVKNKKYASKWTETKSIKTK